MDTDTFAAPHPAVTHRAPPPPPTWVAPPLLAARAESATKVYGKGDTVVCALDDVTVGLPARRFTAVMGPSGSGKSTLMHCLAGLDTLTSGHVFLRTDDGEIDLGALSDRQLTRVRRERIGFVFQAFNLLPTLSAKENITLPMTLAGRQPDRLGRPRRRHRRAAPTACNTARASCPAASSNASPSPAPWRRSRR